MGALLIKVSQKNGIYTLIESFFNEQLSYCFKFFLGYLSYYIQFPTELDAFTA